MNESTNQGDGNARSGGGGNRGRGRKSRGGRGRKGGKKVARSDADQAVSPSGPSGSVSGSADGKKKNSRNRRRRSKRGNGEAAAPKKPMGKVIEYLEPKVHGVLFFDTHAQAKNNIEQIAAKAKDVDVLNIVIKSEGAMTDPEILAHGRLFAGEAWHLIHTRRQEEGWYDGPQPKAQTPPKLS